MTKTCVSDLSDGDAVDEVFLLADKQLRANRHADMYLLATLRDRTGVITGLMWNVTEERLRHISAGDLVRVCGKVQLYQGSLQMIVTRIEPADADDCDPDDFRAQPNANAARLLERLRELLATLEKEPLKALADCFLNDEHLVADLCSAPAGVRAHHAYQGGLIEHIVSMAEVADRLCGLYPQISRDLLLLGVLLHDLGKIRELSWDPALAYTDEGQLLGHMNIAIEILNEKVAELKARPDSVDIDAEDLLRLKHMILSHHGSLEHGSPRVPMTPEALVLHQIDHLDAKLHEFTRTIDDDVNPQSSWTPWSPRMERRLFKGKDRPGASPSS